jgi:hypothetical protein
MAFSSSSSENNFQDRVYRDARIPGLGNTPDDDDDIRGRANGGPSRSNESIPEFDVLLWYPKHLSCQRYFLDHAQHLPEVQAFASFINILLPFQRQPHPVTSYIPSSPQADSRRPSSSSADWNPHHKHAPSTHSARSSQSQSKRPPPTPLNPNQHHVSSPAPFQPPNTVSLTPYIRRLVVCGMDIPPILQGFFGHEWAAGVGPQREQERRNYLFSAKSGGWAAVKRDYDLLPLETVPFIAPLKEPSDGELERAESKWSEWLAMEDWMVGSRAPE